MLDISGSTSFVEGISPFGVPDTTEEAIQKAVNKVMTSFVQTQLAPMLEQILCMLSSMQQIQMQGGVADGIWGRQIIRMSRSCRTSKCLVGVLSSFRFHSTINLHNLKKPILSFHHYKCIIFREANSKFSPQLLTVT